jgi:transposase
VGGTRRKFSEEFKREAVALSYSSGKSIEQVADDLGIHRSLLNRWRKEVNVSGQQAFPGHGVQKLTPLEEENIRLKRELAIVTEEREILKKAVTIFSKKPK